MVCYIYDGSFTGLLTAIYEGYYRRENLENICREEDFVLSFLHTSVFIESNQEKSQKVYNAIIEKISKEFLKRVYYVFLSECKGAEFLIYKYIKLGFKLGTDIEYHLHNEVVLEINKICRKVLNERHGMLGFLRFKMIGENIYYAAMEPDYNVVELVTPHFVKRFQCQKFIIHDRKREIASLYDGVEWVVMSLSVEEGKKLEQSLDEGIYEQLWKEYFKSTTIENRKNLRLQKSRMPERYWKYIIETS